MKKIMVLSIACLSQLVVADPIITFFLRPFPNGIGQIQKFHQKMNQPKTLAKSIIRQSLGLPHVAGIFATYAGYLDISGENGQIVFPRMHQKPYINILITRKLSPIVMFANTVDQWELVPNEPAKMYKANLEVDDDTGVSLWNVTEEALPKNNIVPPLSITIFTKPNKIYIPTGITPTQESTNLWLPDIYVKKGVNIVGQSLYLMNLSLWLRPIEPLYKKEAKRYDILIPS